MPIDPNVVFQGIGGQYTSYPQAEAQNTQNALADQTLQQQRMATEQQKRALEAQKLLSQLLQKHTTLSDGDSSQAATPSSSTAAAPAQPASSGQPDNAVHSASVGTDAYGNVIPKIGTESPAGDAAPAFAQSSNTLAAAGAAEPHPYQESGAPSESHGQNSLASAASAPANNGSAAASSATSTASNAPIAAPSGAGPSAPAAASPYQGGYQRPVTDWDSISRELTAAGYGPEAMKLDTDRRAQMVAAINMQEKQLEVTGKKMAQMGAYAASVPAVNWQETDPGIRQTQTSAAQMAAMTAVKQMGANGLMDPAHAGALMGELQKGYTPQIEAEIRQFANMAMTSAEQHSAHIADLNTARERLTGQATQKKEASEQERLDRQNAGAMLSQARDAQDYADKYKSITDPNIRKYFDDPAHFDQEKTPQRAMMAGMSEQGMGNYMNQQERIHDSKEIQDQRLQDTRDWREQQAGFRQQMLGMEKSRDADRKAGKQTGNAQAVSQINTLQTREQQLHDQRKLLSGAFQSGNVYIDKSGRSIPMDQYVRYADDKAAAKQSAIEDMKERYHIATDDVKNVIQRKNDIAIGQGWSPSVSTSEAMQAIDKGNQPNTHIMGPPLSARGPAAAPANSLASAVKPQTQAAAPKPAPQKPTKQPQDNSEDWIKKIPNFGKTVIDPKSKKSLTIGSTYNSPSGRVVFMGFSPDGKAQARAVNQ